MSESEKNLNRNFISMEQEMLSDSTATTSTQSSVLTQNIYSAPIISSGPAPYQHVRMFSDLLSTICPMIQSNDKNSSEAAHMKIEVLNNIGISIVYSFSSKGSREGW